MKGTKHLYVLSHSAGSRLVGSLNLTRNLNLTGSLAKSWIRTVSIAAFSIATFNTVAFTAAASATFMAQPAKAEKSTLSDQMYVSWYGPGFDGGYTANGEVFSRYKYTAAHPDWPFNTLVQLTNPETGAVVTVRINDRSGGALDISEQAARDLGTYYTGIAPVEVDILRWGE
ncbi:MAG: septal ring lytic transglycosylase RlpA family protein [Cyanobacteria bacterium P01_D01_bin.105]